MEIDVEHPYIDTIRYSLSNGYIKSGERPELPTPGVWNVNTADSTNYRLQDYYAMLNLGNEIKAAVDEMRFGPRSGARAGSGHGHHSGRHPSAGSRSGSGSGGSSAGSGCLPLVRADDCPGYQRLLRVLYRHALHLKEHSFINSPY